MAVNGIEIKVGQVWRMRNGELTAPLYAIPNSPYPFGDATMRATWAENGARDLESDSLVHTDLIELVKDENGFTIWRGGEQPVPDDTKVTCLFKDGTSSTWVAHLYKWSDTNLIAYKVVEQTAAPHPADSATLAEETLSALGWTFDGQTWVENGVVTMEPNALDVQVGGDHYKDCAIQPIEYIHANKLGFAEGNVVKYVTRWKAKNGLKDLEKARHYIDLLIELEIRQEGSAK